MPEACCCYPPPSLLGSPVDRSEYRGHVGFVAAAAVMCKQSGPSAAVAGAAALSAAVAAAVAAAFAVVASVVAAVEVVAAVVEVAVAGESVES